MPDPTNALRAQWAAQAAHRFSITPARCGDRSASPASIEPEVVSDLLADLMHLCRAVGLDFAELLDTAQLNFTDETATERVAD